MTRILDSLISVSQRLVYFDTIRTGGHLTLDDARVFPALGDAMEGTLSVRHSENIVERLARVSSLSFARESAPHRCLGRQQQVACN